MRIGIAFPVIVFIVAVVFLAWFILSGYVILTLHLRTAFVS
ncbi:YoaK family small membrane protein [Klebsiella variicola]